VPGPALAAISHYLDWDHAAAERQFRQSAALAPHVAVVHSWFAEFLLDLRRFDEAAVAVRQAQEAAPRWLEPIVLPATFTCSPATSILRSRGPVLDCRSRVRAGGVGRARGSRGHAGGRAGQA
jgi:hypothetical protein